MIRTSTAVSVLKDLHLKHDKLEFELTSITRLIKELESFYGELEIEEVAPVKDLKPLVKPAKQPPARGKYNMKTNVGGVCERDAILLVFDSAPGPLRAEDVSGYLRTLGFRGHRQSVQAGLSYQRKMGKLTRIEPGLYKKAENPVQQ
jgi:hypothetical protein